MGVGATIITHNCRHSFYPFFAGISQNAYDKATLNDYANKSVTYDGKEMSFYEGTQVQRKLEREIRAAKREAAAVDGAGLDNNGELTKVRALQAKIRDFTRQTGLRRQYVREQAIGKTADIQINFSSENSKIIGKTSDLREYFPDDTPGKEFITSGNVELTTERMKHIKRDHTDQIEWLENNSLIVRKAISSPNFIDALPFQNKKRWAVTHVLEIGDDLYDLLVVGIKHGKSFSEKHSILTMFLAGKRFVLDEFGNVKPRWKKIK